MELKSISFLLSGLMLIVGFALTEIYLLVFGLFLALATIYFSKFSSRDYIRVIFPMAVQIPVLGRLLQASKKGKNEINAIEDEKREEELAEQIYEDFVRIIDHFKLNDYTIEPDKQEVVDQIKNTEILKQVAIPQILIPSFFERRELEFQRTMAVIFLCRELYEMKDEGKVEIETGETSDELANSINKQLSSPCFDFDSPSETERKLLQTYDSLKDAIEGEKVSDTPTIFEDDIEYPRDAFCNLIARFSDDLSMSYSGEDARNLNQRILRTIDNGELNTKRVSEIIEKEKESLKEKEESRQAYLVAHKHIGEDYFSLREDLQKRFSDFIYFGNKWASNDEIFPQSELERAWDDKKSLYKVSVTLHIIIARKSYESAEQFYRRRLKDLADENFLLRVQEVDFDSPYSERNKESLYRIGESNSSVDLAFNFTEYLGNFRASRDLTSKAVRRALNDRIEISQLLRALPLNVFTNIEPEEEDFLMENLGELEGKFGVEEFSDWAGKDHDKLAKELEKRDKKDISDRWNVICKDIIEGVETFS